MNDNSENIHDYVPGFRRGQLDWKNDEYGMEY